MQMTLPASPVRDLGNNGNYADTTSGSRSSRVVLGPRSSTRDHRRDGRQFSPTPETARDHNIVYPEQFDADTHDEIGRPAEHPLGAKDQGVRRLQANPYVEEAFVASRQRD
jgi:hypothetical protein